MWRIDLRRCQEVTTLVETDSQQHTITPVADILSFSHCFTTSLIFIPLHYSPIYSPFNFNHASSFFSFLDNFLFSSFNCPSFFLFCSFHFLYAFFTSLSFLLSSLSSLLAFLSSPLFLQRPWSIIYMISKLSKSFRGTKSLRTSACHLLSSLFFFFFCRTVGQNNQEYRLEYWATRSSVRSYARITHPFACAALLAFLARSTALARLLTLLTPSLVGKRFFVYSMIFHDWHSLNDYKT